MPVLGSNEIGIKVVTSADKKGLDEAEKRIGGFSQKTVAMSQKFAIGLGAMGAAAAAFGVKSLKAFQQQEDAEARLVAGLKNIGEASSDNIKALTDQASALQKVTRFADENIVSGQAMLTTFRLNTGTIKTLIPSMLDMAEGFRKTTGETMDLSQVAVMFGKVMGGAEEGIDGMATSLRKMGVIMTEEQKAVFKYGTEAERAATLTKIMDMNFGGFAEAGGRTFSGRMAQMNNQIGDVQEKIGEAIALALLPLVTAIAEKVLPAFEKMVFWLGQNKEVLIGVAVAVGAMLVPALVALIPVVIKAAAAFAAFAAIPLLIGAIAAGALLLIKNWDKVKQSLTDMVEAVQLSWQLFIDWLKRIGNTIKEAITKPFREAFDWIGEATEKVKKWLSRINPFYRESPSLVDQVREGVAAIRREYATLGPLALPSFGPAAAPALAPAGERTGALRGATVIVERMEVKRDTDIYAFARELGYRIASGA